MTRRNFLSLGMAMVAAPALAKQVGPQLNLRNVNQNGIMVKGKAKECETASLKCPNGHDTCRKIDAPLAVGNDSEANPECFQMRKVHLLACDACGVLFIEERFY